MDTAKPAEQGNLPTPSPDPGPAAPPVPSYSSPQQTPSSSAPPQQSSSHMLQGGIEHSVRLNPVAPQLQAGAVYNEQAMPMPQPNNDWYWIPYWYSGMKHIDTETDVEDYNFRTGATIRPDRVIMNRQDLSIGFQPDRNGQVWEFKRAPYKTTIEGQNVQSVMMVSNRDPLYVNQDKVVIRLLQTQLTVDRSSQRIVASNQVEQINTYVPAGPGVMNLQSSIKTFGSDGSPQVQETNTGLVYTRAPFQPTDYYEGKDMRALFRDYMLSHGFANLLPDNLR